MAPDERTKSASLEVSVVMPCLNEADTLETCIRKAQTAMEEHRIAGEVIVADNGSTDGSVEIASRMGARLVPVKERGYGHALMGGIATARGRFVVMGDADDSYDFGEIPRFLEKLREGFDLVQGCRLPKGGGRILPGAMPFLHRWWGNPDAVLARPADVRSAGHGRVLRTPRLQQGPLRAAGPALHGHGVRHRDDHQGEPAGGATSARCP